MSTLTLPDNLYQGLVHLARQRGKSIEELLKQWLDADAPATMETDEDQRRREAVDNVLALQQEFKKKYGMQPDSTPLIREDRDR